MATIGSRNPVGCRVLTAPPVPFTAEGALDLAGFGASLAPVAAAGLDGVFVAGTTGEFPALSHRERVEVFATAVQAAQGLRVVGHAGAASAREVAGLIREGTAVGVREFAVLTPYYLPASEEETFGFYQRAAEAAEGAPVYAYLFFARTSTPVSPRLLGRIAGIEGIVGAKVSGEDLASVLRYRAAVPDGFEIFTGNDADMPAAKAAGITGVVSGVSAAYPELFARMIAALATGEAATIQQAAEAVQDAVGVIGGDIARIKHAQSLRGLAGGSCRMPIGVPDPHAAAEIQRTIDAYV